MPLNFDVGLKSRYYSLAVHPLSQGLIECLPGFLDIKRSRLLFPCSDRLLSTKYNTYLPFDSDRASTSVASDYSMDQYRHAEKRRGRFFDVRHSIIHIDNQHRCYKAS